MRPLRADTHTLPMLAALAVVTVVAFWGIGSAEFVNYDDPSYVTDNTGVRDGVTLRGIIWALTQTHSSNWHPLTWISHAIDCQLFGLNPGWHHWMNVLIHLVNVLLLFLCLRDATGTVWRSAGVAALFAVHPLHVESVAWISERKDVLSTLFWLLTIWAYVRHVRQPKAGWFRLVIAGFILGMMSKPVVVTLPFVLLLLDYWPLSRGRTPFRMLVREKIPLFALAGALCIITMAAQRHAIQSADALPLFTRIDNAVISYLSYLIDMFWPSGLAVFYPYDYDQLTPQMVAGSLLALAGVSYAVFRGRRRWPFLGVGWCWYLGTLAPMIGIVQVGLHARADRYTYISLIGVFILVVWGLAALTARWRHQRAVIAIAGTAALAALLVTTRAQVGHWQNSVTLFTHAIEVTDGNFIAHTSLAIALREQGDNQAAIDHYEQSLKVNPLFYLTDYNYGIALEDAGQETEAIVAYRRALMVNPNHEKSHLNLGILLHRQGKIDEAIDHYQAAFKSNPENYRAVYNLGYAYEDKGDIDGAMRQYATALRMKPDYEQARTNLRRLQQLQDKAQSSGSVDTTRSASLPVMTPAMNAAQHIQDGNRLARQGRFAEALIQYAEARRIDPDDADTYVNMGNVYFLQGQIDTAIVVYSQALQYQPDKVEAHMNLANAYLSKLQEHYIAVLEAQPGHADAHVALANLYMIRNEVEPARAHFLAALKIDPSNAAARLGLDRLRQE